MTSAVSHRDDVSARASAACIALQLSIVTLAMPLILAPPRRKRMSDICRQSKLDVICIGAPPITSILF